MEKTNLRGEISGLYQYPVKGLSAQSVESVVLTPGRCFPLDRLFAIARGDGKFNPANPTASIDKGNFFVLREEARLAGLQSSYNPENGRLTLSVAGRRVLDVAIDQPDDRDRLLDFIGRMFEQKHETPPLFAHAEPHRFTDAPPSYVSLINSNSLTEFAGRIGEEMDPRRFRANVYFDGWPAWSERELPVGEVISMGPVTVRKSFDTPRCAATEVNPATAARDIPVPKLLKDHYGHSDLGIYVEVLEGGELRSGAQIRL
jgi:uncharacterized protein YcbX